MNDKIRKYGWSKKLADTITDKHLYYFQYKGSLPLNVDLRYLCPRIYNQLNLGSCTANAVAAAYYVEEIKKNVKYKFTPSRLFMYYNTRNIEGTVNSDSGALLSDCMLMCSNYGVCNETLWKYDVKKFNVNPPKYCYNNALIHKIKKYFGVVQSLTQLKQCLANKTPFVFGFLVFSSFESPYTSKTGIVTMPLPGESILGGHAVLCVGYNDNTKYFIVRNSWGIDWGDRGYFYMPYDYVVNSGLCSDFWAINKITV